MSSNNINAILPSIEELFGDIRVEVNDIGKNTADKEATIKAICDYVTKTLTAESKSLLNTLYSKMADETLSKEPFLNSGNKSKFYALDLRSHIYNKYNFSNENKVNYKQANENLLAISGAVGTVAVGAVLSRALPAAGAALSTTTIVVSVVIAGFLYFWITKNAKNKSDADFLRSIQQYIETLKEEFIIWFENIERYYNEQVEELKKTL